MPSELLPAPPSPPTPTPAPPRALFSPGPSTCRRTTFLPLPPAGGEGGRQSPEPEEQERGPPVHCRAPACRPCFRAVSL